MPYVNRRTAKKRAGSAELMYLVIVLVAGFATAWWAGQRVGMDLSSVTAVASILGMTETGRSGHGAAGYQPTADVQTSPPTVAPYCSPNQAPSFAPSMGRLKQHVGEVMGAPVECEHAAPSSGDTIQQTSTGLAVYNKRTNVVSFTDGWRHWAMTSRGLVTWEGTDSDPPAE